MTGSSPTVIVRDSLTTVQQTAAQHIARMATEAIEESGMFVMALSGGSTPGGTYHLLAQSPYCDEIDWSRVYIIWGDERYVPHDDRASCYRLAREALLDHVPIPVDHIFPMPTSYDDASDAAREYDIRIRSLLEMNGGYFHLALQGMGDDGHTSSLFPYSPALQAPEETLVVVVEDAPKPPPRRLSLTISALNLADHVLFLVAGAEKANALCETVEGLYDPHRWPAQMICPQGKTVTWLVDTAAAAQLSMKVRSTNLD